MAALKFENTLKEVGKLQFALGGEKFFRIFS